MAQSTYLSAHSSGVQKSGYRTTGSESRQTEIQLSVELRSFLKQLGRNLLQCTWPNSATSGCTAEIQFPVTADLRSLFPYCLLSYGSHDS